MPKTPKDRLASKKANVRRIWIPMDPEVAEAYEKAKEEFELAKIIANGDESEQNSVRLEATRTTFSEAEAALREDAVCFQFRGIGRKKYDKLVGDHRPSERTKERVTELGGDPRFTPFDPETFPPVIISASLIDPELTVGEVEGMYDDDDWNGAELTALLETALEANTEYRQVELGKG